LEIFALLIFVLAIWLTYKSQNAALEDQADFATIYTEQIGNTCQLQSGEVEVVLYRQSGNEYRDLGVFSDAASAIAEVSKSFNRAKIEAVRVVRNTPSEFKVHRLYHSHVGRAEGKKLGGAVIRSIA
jgi:hypothetical protein